MIIEDACELNLKAIGLLLARRGKARLKVKRVETLSQFLRCAQMQKLSRRDKERTVDQAILMVDQFYPHLPFKRARYAIDPVQRLRLLRANLGHGCDEMSFHSDLLQVFAELRDPHTFYQLPSPYQGSIAFLAFFLQSYIEGTGGQRRRRFLVTDVLPGFDHRYFKRGVEVTHWNGMPVERAVERLAEHIPGGNPAAKFIRGMMRMTVRSLGSTIPPDEEMTFVRYKPLPTKAGPAEERTIAVPWNVGVGAVGRVSSLFERQGGVSVCEPLRDLANVRRVLWGHKCSPDPTIGHSTLGNVFEFQHSLSLPVEGRSSGKAGPPKRFGLIRIKTFFENPDLTLDEFQRILGLMKTNAPDGVILDVRSNAGGKIAAAEMLLQLICPSPVTPAPFHFANTPAVLDVLAKLRVFFKKKKRRPNFNLGGLRDWLVKDSLEAVASGSLLTEGHALTNSIDANRTGQIYHGPVVLLIDAACYSATDIFSAGFQDHGIGPIIGVDENTGGGGASRWLHREEMIATLRAIPGLDLPLHALPGDAAMALAVLRSARVGAYAGQPLEDLGVKRDIEYDLTRDDLLHEDADLIAFACRTLSKMTVYKLEVKGVTLSIGGVDVTVETENLKRLVCCLDGRPQLAVDAFEGKIHVPFVGFEKSEPERLTIEGYAWRPRTWSGPGRSEQVFGLVASRTVSLDGT